MLISPPFLIARATNQSEDAWIDACMVGGAVGDGAFPVSLNLGWHGGMHLNAPMNGNVAESVRAIADGTVVYFKQPTPRPADPPATHPQMYRGQWTDNGVVVIRHDTEIGDGANGKVSYFSIYMHMGTLESTTVIRGRAIYRKTVLGTAGRIYGEQNKIHFEIITDDANLAKLAGRAQGDVPLAADGRADAVYGDMYFHVPAGAAVFAQKPLGNNATAMMQPPTPHGQRVAPPPVELQPISNTTGEIIVSLNFTAGDANLTSYEINGTSLGAAISEHEAEYSLYSTATAVSKAYPETARPSPSAIYDLLRFGRTVGPDVLMPNNVPHWRKIHHSDGQGWINLNTAVIHKFSDADLPHWKAWRLIADDTNADSRCDSATIKGWLDISGDGKVDPIEATTKLSDPLVAAKLKRTICKFPTEWEAATIDDRWGWLKTASDENPTAVSEEDFARLKAHIDSLCFWGPANLQTQPIAATDIAPAVAAAAIPANHWHWNPREFVRHFRTCGWLSKNELARIYPDNKYPLTAFRTEGRGRTPELVREQFRLEINKVCRKYFVSVSNVRMTHFFGQGAVESMYLALMLEGSASFSRNPRHASFQSEANGFYVPSSSTDYLFYLEGRLGNIDTGDGPKFRGRGMKQLTGRENYSKYWVYRGWLSPDSFTSPWWNPARPTRAPDIPDPQRLSTDAFNAIDAGGWYWDAGAASNQFRSINSIITSNQIDRASVRAVARAINGVNRQTGEPNGLNERLAESEAAQLILMDGT
jgi:predicted chitinase